VREADMLLHVVDISHPNFEEQINIVHQTLQDLGALNRPTYLVFNKIDAYHFIEKEADDLTPVSRENLSLQELKNTWMAKNNASSIFISALHKTNISELKDVLYQQVKKIHVERYPFNDFLY
jgi:GTPase